MALLKNRLSLGNVAPCAALFSSLVITETFGKYFGPEMLLTATGHTPPLKTQDVDEKSVEGCSDGRGGSA